MAIKVLEVNVDDNGMGGVYSFVKNVIKGKDKKLKIDIASLESFEDVTNEKELNSYDCEIHYVGREGNQLLKQIGSFFKLIALQHKCKYDCVHIHSDLSVKLFIYGLACKVARVKKIMFHSHASGAEGKHLKLKQITQFFFGKSLKYIGTDFLACSDFAGQWMYPNLKPEKITVVNNGIDLNKFRYNAAERVEVRKRLGIDENFVVGHVGRFSNVKNHRYLVDVVNVAKDFMPNIKLLLVGEGPLIDEVKMKVDSMRLTDYVIFYGSTNSVNSLYQAMDIFVMPSLREGFPIVGVEAQASGLPVFFSDRITKTAKLTDDVKYLSIDDNSIDKWVTEIVQYKDYTRYDVYQILKEKKFDVSDTVKMLSDLYKS